MLIGVPALAEGRTERGATLPAAARGAWSGLGGGHLRSPVPALISDSAALAAKCERFGNFTARGRKFDLATAVSFAPGEKETPPEEGRPTGL